MADPTTRTLNELHDEIRVCTACPLHETRCHAVPGEGDAHAPLMFVGEAPGATEDKTGRPFVGQSGKYLAKLIHDVLGLEREQVFITSSCKCRPPKNRTPRALELTTCFDLWLSRQFELIDPQLVVLLGKTPMKQVLGETGALRDLHGTTREHDGRRFFLTYHPAGALRSESFRDQMRADFDKLAELSAALYS